MIGIAEKRTSCIGQQTEEIMLTSKQRAFLRGMANGLDAIFQVGKNGVTPELRDTVHNALEARELGPKMTGGLYAP